MPIGYAVLERERKDLSSRRGCPYQFCTLSCFVLCVNVKIKPSLPNDVLEFIFHHLKSGRRLEQPPPTFPHLRWGGREWFHMSGRQARVQLQLCKWQALMHAAPANRALCEHELIHYSKWGCTRTCAHPLLLWPGSKRLTAWSWAMAQGLRVPGLVDWNNQFHFERFSGPPLI